MKRKQFRINNRAGESMIVRLLPDPDDPNPDKPTRYLFSKQQKERVFKTLGYRPNELNIVDTTE